MASAPSPVSPTTRTQRVQGRFGFANIGTDIFLVQLISSPAPKTYRAHLFRHNFVSVFSFSHTQTLTSNLLEILAEDGNQKPQCWLEEETGTVFVTQDVMRRYIWLKDFRVPGMGGVGGTLRLSLPRRRCDGDSIMHVGHV